MCRHLCYLGTEPILLRDLLFDPPHSLVRQSFAPCDMRGGGKVNADGFGAGWYVEPAGPAVRYRRAGPIWQDTAFGDLAANTSAVTVLAAIRNATVGMPITETAAAPFTDGHWLFSLNGRIDGWPDSAAELAGTLPVRGAADDGCTDRCRAALGSAAASAGRRYRSGGGARRPGPRGAEGRARILG